jgi:hypothetical protein
MITLTIDEEGQKFIASHGADIFAEPTDTVRRASYVVPDRFWLRLAFRIIRACVPDAGQIANWSRSWRCIWRIDTSPVGGPILGTRYGNREHAIEAEIDFLNQLFLGEKI